MTAYLSRMHVVPDDDIDLDLDNAVEDEDMAWEVHDEAEDVTLPDAEATAARLQETAPAPEIEDVEIVPDVKDAEISVATTSEGASIATTESISTSAQPTENDAGILLSSNTATGNRTRKRKFDDDENFQPHTIRADERDTQKVENVQDQDTQGDGTQKVEDAQDQDVPGDGTQKAETVQERDVPGDGTQKVEDAQDRDTQGDENDKKGVDSIAQTTFPEASATPIEVMYRDTEMALFPCDLDLPSILTDTNLLEARLTDLLEACRQNLQEVKPNEEMILLVHDLGLFISQAVALTTECTLGRILRLHEALHRHDGHVRAPSLCLSLCTRVRFADRLAFLDQRAAAGEGFATTVDSELGDPLGSAEPENLGVDVKDGPQPKSIDEASPETASPEDDSGHGENLDLTDDLQAIFSERPEKADGDDLDKDDTNSSLRNDFGPSENTGDREKGEILGRMNDAKLDTLDEDDLLDLEEPEE